MRIDYTQKLAGYLEVCYDFAEGAGPTASRPASIPDLVGQFNIDMQYSGTYATSRLTGAGMRLANNANGHINTHGAGDTDITSWSATKLGQSRFGYVEFTYHEAVNHLRGYLLEFLGLWVLIGESGSLVIQWMNRSTHRFEWIIPAGTFQPKDLLRLATQVDYVNQTYLLVINGVEYTGTTLGDPFANGTQAQPEYTRYIGRHTSWNNYYGWDGTISKLALAYGFTKPLTLQELTDMTTSIERPFVVQDYDEDYKGGNCAKVGTSLKYIEFPPLTAEDASGRSFTCEWSAKRLSIDTELLGNNTTTNHRVYASSTGDISVIISNSTTTFTGGWPFSLSGFQTLRLECYTSVSGNHLKWFLDGVQIGNEELNTGDITSFATTLTNLGKSSSSLRSGYFKWFRFTDHKNSANNRFWSFDVTGVSTITDKINGVVANARTVSGEAAPDVFESAGQDLQVELGAGKQYTTTLSAWNAIKDLGRDTHVTVKVFGRVSDNVSDLSYNPNLTFVTFQGSNQWTDRSSPPVDGLEGNYALGMGWNTLPTGDGWRPIEVKDLYLAGSFAIEGGWVKSGSAYSIERCYVKGTQNHGINLNHSVDTSLNYLWVKDSHIWGYKNPIALSDAVVTCRIEDSILSGNVSDDRGNILSLNACQDAAVINTVFRNLGNTATYAVKSQTGNVMITGCLYNNSESNVSNDGTPYLDCQFNIDMSTWMAGESSVIPEAEAKYGFGNQVIAKNFVATPPAAGLTIQLGVTPSQVQVHEPTLIAPKILKPSSIVNISQIPNPILKKSKKILLNSISSTSQVFAPGSSQDKMIYLGSIVSTSSVATPFIKPHKKLILESFTNLSVLQEPKVKLDQKIQIGTIPSNSSVFFQRVTGGETPTVVSGQAFRKKLQWHKFRRL